MTSRSMFLTGKTLCLPLLLALSACDDSVPATDIAADECAPVRNVNDVIQVYGSAWNEPDATRRLCALQRSMIETATYVDPTIDVATHADLSKAIGDFQTSFAGASIVQLSGIDARAGELRFAWDVRMGGASVVTGLDYIQIAQDGRIESLRGYWDPMPIDAPTGVMKDYLAALQASDAAARRASLDLAVAEDVRFTTSDASATGIAALAERMRTPVTVTGSQAYPKYARVALSIEGSREASEYLHFGDDGKILSIARFVGPLPAP